jgi:flagellar protein FliS
MMNQSALGQYQSVSVQGGLTDASPHQMITMQLDGALDRVASAKGAILRNEISRKGELLSSLIAIIDSLRASLNLEHGGDIAANLFSLYDYMERQLLEVNMTSDVVLLDQVGSLLKEIRMGWGAIPVEARQG